MGTRTPRSQFLLPPPHPNRLKMTVKRPAPEFYLARVADELVVKTGKNSMPEASSKQRILIIGGGVTGLTVSSSTFRVDGY
jgi:hypothetical protein